MLQVQEAANEAGLSVSDYIRNAVLSVDEIKCPSCGDTIRARMSDM